MNRLPHFSPALTTLSLSSNELYSQGARIVSDGIDRAVEKGQKVHVKLLDLRYNGIAREEKAVLVACCQRHGISLKV